MTKNFGLSLDELAIIKTKIQEVFGTETDLKAYIFGSRAIGKNRINSDIDIALKSKDTELDKKIYILKDRLEESNLPYKVDIVNWNRILKEYFPQIQKQKKKLWDKKDAIVYSPWRVCPIGQHWVREHPKTGNRDTTDPHCRWNKSRHDILKTDEIHLIAQSGIFKNVSIKASPNNLKFPHFKPYFDELINGWCAYWNYTLKAKDPIHPNLVKALLATESGFEVNPKGGKGDTAIGIGQLMPVTIGYLSQRNKELKDHFIEITKAEALDPNVNICASIRWLFRKYEIANRRKKVSWLKVLEEYKGITKQQGKKSNKIRSKAAEYYDLLERK
jgi:predicted nucleotidyltransferase